MGDRGSAGRIANRFVVLAQRLDQDVPENPGAMVAMRNARGDRRCQATQLGLTDELGSTRCGWRFVGSLGPVAKDLSNKRACSGVTAH